MHADRIGPPKTAAAARRRADANSYTPEYASHNLLKWETRHVRSIGGLLLSSFKPLSELATEAGLAVLFTTHDPNVALRVADKVTLLRDGRPLAFGAASEVLTRVRFEHLYGAPVRGAGAAPDLAFLPG